MIGSHAPLSRLTSDPARPSSPRRGAARRAESWDDFVTDLCASHKPWWIDLEDEAGVWQPGVFGRAMRAMRASFVR